MIKPLIEDKLTQLQVDLSSVEIEGYQKFENGDSSAMHNFLMYAIFSPKHEMNYEGCLDNELVGVQELRKEELAELVGSIIKAGCGTKHWFDGEHLVTENLKNEKA